MKGMHDTLGEVEIIDASEGITIRIKHDGEEKDVLRRAVALVSLAPCDEHIFKCERCGVPIAPAADQQ